MICFMAYRGVCDKCYELSSGETLYFMGMAISFVVVVLWCGVT